MYTDTRLRQRELFSNDAEPCEPQDEEHDCLAHFDDGRNTPDSPDHLVEYRCEECGKHWTFNVRTGAHEEGRR